MPSFDSLRRRSLSESCKLQYLASQQLQQEQESLACLPLPEEPVDDHHPLVLAVGQGGESLAALEHRSKSESFICTAQGVMFQDAKSRYQSKLDSLVEMAASTSGSQSNVLLAKKALRYRKVLERRRIME